jgi:hypothetical protein
LDDGQPNDVRMRSASRARICPKRLSRSGALNRQLGPIRDAQPVGKNAVQALSMVDKWG